jgi:hypothetical protein
MLSTNNSLLLLSSTLALLELDNLTKVPNSLALVWLRWPLGTNRSRQVTDSVLACAADSKGGVLLDLCREKKSGRGTSGTAVYCRHYKTLHN